MRGAWLGLAIVAASSGCAAGINSDLGVAYAGDPSADPVRVGEIAILPVNPGPGLEPHRRLFLESLGDEIAAESGIFVADAEFVGRRIDEAGLVNDYAQLLIAHAATGVTDSDVVRRVSQAIGVRYLLLARFSYASAQVVEYNALLEYPTSEKLQELQVVAQIWDGDRGTVAWELGGLVSSKPSTFTVSRPVEDIVLAATRDVARSLPIAHVAVPRAGSGSVDR